ncbi:hypothetical protein [Franzmannia qiaohouensis]|uniref:Uncharacterized protein n=1 Tax=Franzmannia qiaohouensis TaxID=1329370 RepID=A0ABU1HAD7_9GAMM|nr:hypothetical protein [Halomonas qiaohouensis]MDR5904420.1 hypothetical protein [Halomonas qiaohouensis]
MRKITPQDRENAKRLKGIWNRKKPDLGLTQAKAAHALGYAGQGAVGQYLNCHIALNYEAVIAFAKLLRVEPWEIDPSLGSLRQSEVEERGGGEIPIARTLTRHGTPTNTSITTRYDYMEGQCYGVEIDSDEYRPFAKRGTTVIASRAEEPLPGDDVVIAQKDGTLVLGEFHGGDNASVTITRHSTLEKETMRLSNIQSIDPIVEICMPRTSRPRRLHSIR